AAAQAGHAVAGGGGHAAAHGGPAVAGKIAAKTVVGISRRALTAALATTAVAGGGAAVVVHHHAESPPAARATVVSATTVPAPRLTLSPAPRSPAPSRTTTAGPRRTTAAPEPVTRASAKKGVGVWRFNGAEAALADVGAGWYYTWAPNDNGVPGPAGVEFVPMIWGAQNVTDATLAEAKREGDGVLLGFNEPDLAGQANMSVAEALAAWPELERTGMRLGSPAVAFGADTEGGWLDRFMTGAEDRGLRVDFLTLHWYGSDFSDAAVGHFLGYVDAVHRKYGKPIWVTEYGLMNFGGAPRYPTGAQAAAFINGSTDGLEKRRYVERYAWFGLPAVGDSLAFGLYRDGDTPTEAGRAYRQAG
ncbi:MAG TPA: glycosyl hydrolase, partial [Actinoplanes sp.]|nr:glycosyl hydrolase [Actinoplanes sp.]